MTRVNSHLGEIGRTQKSVRSSHVVSSQASDRSNFVHGFLKSYGIMCFLACFILFPDFYPLETKASGLRVPRRSSLDQVSWFLGHWLFWRSIQNRGQADRISVCCQKGNLCVRKGELSDIRRHRRCVLDVRKSFFTEGIVRH